MIAVDSFSLKIFRYLILAMIFTTLATGMALYYLSINTDRLMITLGEESSLLAERNSGYNFWLLGVSLLLSLTGLIAVLTLHRFLHRIQPMLRKMEKAKGRLHKTVINLNESLDGLKKTNQELRQKIQGSKLSQ